MAAIKTKKTTTKKVSAVDGDTTVAITPVLKTSTSKVVHVTSGDVIEALNSAVVNVNSVFQLRDQLLHEVDVLKNELNVGNEVRIEMNMMEDLKKEEDRFVYDFNIKKERLESELKQTEKDQKDKLLIETNEHKNHLKSEAETQAQKFKIEKEEHIRKIAREKDDWERERDLFTAEESAFEERVKTFEKEQGDLREKMIKELNRDNAHAVELLKGELRLEQASRAKFEALLTEAREHNEKLGEQLATLSREALSSASTSSMAAKLKDIISEMSHTSSQRVS